MILLSVVCATVDSPVLVLRAIESIRQAAAGVPISVQIIVVDQSKDADCLSLLDTCSDLDLIVIHSKKRGLSYSRNLGLDRATGDFAMFWDADCLLDSRFFVQLGRLVSAFPEAKLFYGAIKCPLRGRNVFREWPAETRSVSMFRRWQVSTSVNCVWRNDTLNGRARLDERFGIGSTFGSCEDVDFFVRLQGAAVYSPDLVVYHPDQNVNDVPVEKARSYSFGFGAVCRKHARGFGVLYLTVTLLKKIYQILLGQVNASTGMALIRERLRGFVAFKS
jgi:glycosyltransferase involved in cell wall biosynthesis